MRWMNKMNEMTIQVSYGMVDASIDSSSHPFISIILFIFLIPCAIQDWRDNRVTNWLTVPAFIVAWVMSYVLGNLLLAVLVCFGCYVAWSFGWMGAADGKLATLLAAVSPPTLFICTILLALTFLYLRARGQSDLHLPAIVWFCAGSGLYTCIALVQTLFR